MKGKDDKPRYKK